MEELNKKVEGNVTEFKDLYFATTSVVTDLGKNHQLMLKSFLERLLDNGTFEGISTNYLFMEERYHYNGEIWQ